MRRNWSEFLLTLVALITGGAVPVSMLLLAGMYAMQRHGVALQQLVRSVPPPELQMRMMQSIHQFMVGYIRYLWLPSLVLLLLIPVISWRRYPRLANRIVAGVGAGILLTIGLDIVRLTGVWLGAFPGDMPTMFGRMITGEMGTSAAVLLAGYSYHFLNGIDFALVYTLVAGKVRWYWALPWALFIELGMMVSPPVMMTAGPFGIHGFWPWLFIVTLLAHVVMGVVLGVFAERWVRDEGSLLGLIRRAEAVPVQRRPAMA